MNVPCFLRSAFHFFLNGNGPKYKLLIRSNSKKGNDCANIK